MSGRCATRRYGTRRAARRAMTAALAAAAGLAALALPGPAEAQVWTAQFDSFAFEVNVWGFDGGQAAHTGLKSFTYRGVTYNVNRLSVSGTLEQPLRHLRFELDRPVPDELVLAISASPSGSSGSVSVNTSDGRKSNGGNRLDFTLPYGLQLFVDGRTQLTTSVKVALSDFSPFHLRRPAIRQATSPSNTSMEISWEVENYSKFHPERHVDGWQVELRGEDGGTRSARVDGIATTSHVFSGLRTGQLYYARVRPRFKRAAFQRDSWHRWSQYVKKVAGSPNPVDPVTTEFVDIPGPPRPDPARPGYVKASGDEVVLNFTENIRPAMLTRESNGVVTTLQDFSRPAPSLFTVTAGGAGAPISFERIFITRGTKQVLLMGANPTIPQGGTVRVSYTDPDPEMNDTHDEALNDWAGTDVESFAQVALENRSTQAADANAPPTPIDAFYSGDDSTITVEFDKDLSGTDFPGTGAFGIAIGGSARTISSAYRTNANHKHLVLEFASRGAADRALVATASYTEPASGNKLEGTGGAEVASFAVPVRDDEQRFDLIASDVTVAEGAGATAEFTVTLVPAADETVTVDYETRDGSATAPADYIAASGTLTFAPGETTKTVSVTVVDDAVADDGETFDLDLSNATGPTGANISTFDGTATITNHEDRKPALTAAFSDMPASHGGDGFTVELAFNEEFPLSYRLLQGADGQPSVVAAAGGRVTGARRVERGKNRRWRIAVAPDGQGDVTLTLPATTDCAADDAICTQDSRPLSAAATVRVPGAAPEGAAFTVRLASVPVQHDGETAVAFEVHFSENPEGFSYRTLRDETLRLTQGATRLTPGVSRLLAGSNRGWRVTVTPASKADLGIAIAATADCAAAGAVCDEDGRPLSAGVAATVLGPPGLAVADARVREAAGATMDFSVTMSRASFATVTVDYATADGTAIAGADYAAASGTLSFAPGETEKTVSVPVLDDAVDDDGETFTLALGNPAGGDAWLADAEAVGTIENDDAMPSAWLVRFGRTVASQAVDAIGARMQGGGGSQVTVAGQLLALSRGPMTEERRAETEAALGALARRGAALTRSIAGREALLRSSFSLAAGGDGSGFGAWGRVAVGGFDAEAGGTRLDGEVATGFLGVDFGSGRWLAGVALSLSEGEGSYAQTEGPDRGELESTLTAVYPYARLAVSDGLDLWGVAGYGEGRLTLRQHANAEANRPRALRHRTGIAMRMAAVGARGEVLSPETTGGLRMAIRSDALWVRTTSDAARGGDGALAASKAEVTRLRLAVEGSRRFPLMMGALTPALELGLRHDGGDAETGFGVEAGASLTYEGAGFSVEGAVRALVAHRDEGYREWGASAALRVDPGAAGQGLSVTLAPSLGAAPRGADRLWSAAGARGPGAFRPERRLESEIGYGVALPGAGLLTPHAGLALGAADGRAWRLGARWRAAPGATVSLQATRREPAGGVPPEHRATLRGAVRW